MERAKLRVMFSAVSHETNSFAPGMTELDEFRLEWAEGQDIVRNYEDTGTFAGGVIAAARSLGLELLPGLYTDGNASGTVSDACADELIRRLLACTDDEHADGMVLMLHGAMVSEGVADQESKIMREIREKVGRSFPLALVLDLHANITQDMVDLADIIVCEDTYPHVDAYDRGYEATELLVRYIRGEIRPTKAFSSPGMLLLPQTMVTAEGPMKTIVERALEMERDPAVINVVVAGGFPYSDVPYPGISFVVTTNNDDSLARKYADELSGLAWGLRREFHLEQQTPLVAIRMAEQLSDEPVILVEASDNVGGGAPADATHVLRHLPECGKRSLTVIRDRAAAELAHKLGTGARFKWEVGGKTDALHGAPVLVEGHIRVLSDGKYRHTGRYMHGQMAQMGKTAVVECGVMTVVLTEERAAPWDPGHVTSLGLNPGDYHIIVVKSALAWKTAFGDIAKHVIHVDTPGCCDSSLARLPYRHLHRPVFPLDEYSSRSIRTHSGECKGRGNS